MSNGESETNFSYNHINDLSYNLKSVGENNINSYHNIVSNLNLADRMSCLLQILLSFKILFNTNIGPMCLDDGNHIYYFLGIRKLDNLKFLEYRNDDEYVYIKTNYQIILDNNCDFVNLEEWNVPDFDTVLIRYYYFILFPVVQDTLNGLDDNTIEYITEDLSKYLKPKYKDISKNNDRYILSPKIFKDINKHFKDKNIRDFFNYVINVLYTRVYDILSANGSKFTKLDIVIETRPL